VIPSNVEILGSSCFCGCRSLSSISFESNSRLKGIESRLNALPLLVALRHRPSVQQLFRLSLPLFQSSFRG
jgi:hypothetical protein